MNVSYDYYRIFTYVAQYGSISRAAEQLCASQPNLTRAIRNLEAELGCTLFARTNRGMLLTPEGELLYSHTRIALEQLQAAEIELTASRNLQAGTVFLAASEVALRCLLLPVLKEYRLRYPGIHLRISNHSTPQAVNVLQGGTADLAVVTTPAAPPPALKVTPIRTVREAVVAPAAWTQLSGRKVKLQELLAYPLISLAADTTSFSFYSDFFAAHGLPYQPEIEAFTSDQILPMVEAGLGIGFVPEDFLEPSNQVLRIELEEPLSTRTLCLMKRREQPLSAAAKALERMLLSASGSKKSGNP